MSEQTKLSLIAPINNTACEVLHGGQWLPASILIAPNNDSHPSQRISTWKVLVHIGQGVTKYVWNASEIRLKSDELTS